MAKDYRDTVFLPRTDFPMKAGLAAAEPAICARWEAERLYAKARAARAQAPKWIFHDGPPYANGDMHLGHAMNHTLKDIACRTHGLLGCDAPYIPGWDCHGLPIEWKVEEANRAKGREKGDVDFLAFRAECRAYAAHWVNVQREQLKRLGVLADWDEPYLTMDYSAEATIAAELLKFAESGQVYRGAKPVMWSPVERTALAEAEVEYEDVTSTQVDVAFEIVEAPNAPELVGAHAVIWTTTPWTLPVNRALAFGAEVAYVLVAAGERRLLVAEPLVEAVRARLKVTGEVAWRGQGAMLAGAVARHPLHALGGFFTEPRPLLAGDFVTTDQGTGLVHMAPDHGEDDFALCKAHGIDPLFVVQGDGTYRSDWPVVGGSHVYKVNAPDGPICSALREAGGLLAASADYRHSYPHSWRSKAKLIYRCTPQWFVAMDRDLGDGTTLRGRALAGIDATRWLPARGYNRIRAMVEDRPDWVLSRQRAWGVPITLFVHRATGEYLRDPHVNARIVEAFRERGADAWWTTDPAEFLGALHDPADYEQVTDILDVWFDSGCTHAFVVEARHGVEQADLYLEGSDQHRGWFQSSLLESAGTRGRAPYKCVVTHGMALDGQGRKMSKSLGNVIDPNTIIGVHGADVLRLWVASVDYQEDVRLSDEILRGVTDNYRKLRNTLRYLLGALDGWRDGEAVARDSMPELERWACHEMAVLDVSLRAAIGDFDWRAYTGALMAFVNRMSASLFDVRKDVLYCDAPDSLSRRAYRTMLHAMRDRLILWLAPVLVFTAEEAWGHAGHDGSVHLAAMPELPADWRDDALAERFARLQALRDAVALVLEPMRQAKAIRGFGEAEVVVPAALAEGLEGLDLATELIVGRVTVDAGADGVRAAPTDDAKCARCWRHLPDVADDLCARCADVVAA